VVLSSLLVFLSLYKPCAKVPLWAVHDSGAIGMFMDQKMAAKYGFRLQKLSRLIMVRNVNGTNNSAEPLSIRWKQTYTTKAM